MNLNNEDLKSSRGKSAANISLKGKIFESKKSPQQQVDIDDPDTRKNFPTPKEISKHISNSL